MISPQAQALELEGTWQIEVTGLDVTPGAVDIENRGLVGASSSHHIRGDFRLNANAIIAFLYLRGRTGADASGFLIQLKGAINLSNIELHGALADEPSRKITVRLYRAPR